MRDPVDQAMHELEVIAKEADAFAHDLREAETEEPVERTRSHLIHLVSCQQELLRRLDAAGAGDLSQEMGDMMTGTLAHVTVWFLAADGLKKRGLGAGPRGV